MVGFPESVYSVTKPKQFNGPLPEIKFSDRFYKAALGGSSALRYISLNPSSTEDFPIEVKTMLPFQPNQISMFPSKMIMPAFKG